MKRANASWSVTTLAVPSRTTGSQALSVAIEQRGHDGLTDRQNEGAAPESMEVADVAQLLLTAVKREP